MRYSPPSAWRLRQAARRTALSEKKIQELCADIDALSVMLAAVHEETIKNQQQKLFEQEVCFVTDEIRGKVEALKPSIQLQYGDKIAAEYDRVSLVYEVVEASDFADITLECVYALIFCSLYEKVYPGLNERSCDYDIGPEPVEEYLPEHLDYLEKMDVPVRVWAEEICPSS